MTDQTAIEHATRRLPRRWICSTPRSSAGIEIDRSRASLAEQVHALDADRSKLAADLDAQLGKVRGLESANRDVARRLDAAMDNIRPCLKSRTEA